MNQERQNPANNRIAAPPANTGRERLSHHRMLKWAAAIAIPVGIAAVIGVTQYDKISVNFTNTAGIMSSVVSRFSAASLVEKKQAPPAPAFKPVQKISLPVEASPEVVVKPAINTNDKFAVIVGAFRVQENAEKLVAELLQKGIEAAIFDQSKTGLFRVTIATGSSRAEANQLLASANSSEFSGAWVLAK